MKELLINGISIVALAALFWAVSSAVAVIVAPYLRLRRQRAMNLATRLRKEQVESWLVNRPTEFLDRTPVEFTPRRRVARRKQ